MSILSNLTPASGAVKSEKRIARGQGSGHGGTATRGHKGHKSRSGYSQKRGFEGGQMPIQRRVPKRGFKNFNRVEYLPINLGELQRLAEKHNISTFTFEVLRQYRITQQDDKVKILGEGELTRALRVSAHAFSESAKQAIENAGGTVTVL